eukprot:423149_1
MSFKTWLTSLKFSDDIQRQVIERFESLGANNVKDLIDHTALSAGELFTPDLTTKVGIIRVRKMIQSLKEIRRNSIQAVCEQNKQKKSVSDDNKQKDKKFATNLANSASYPTVLSPTWAQQRSGKYQWQTDCPLCMKSRTGWFRQKKGNNTKPIAETTSPYILTDCVGRHFRTGNKEHTELYEALSVAPTNDAQQQQTAPQQTAAQIDMEAPEIEAAQQTDVVAQQIEAQQQTDVVTQQIGVVSVLPDEDDANLETHSADEKDTEQTTTNGLNSEESEDEVMNVTNNEEAAPQIAAINLEEDDAITTSAPNAMNMSGYSVFDGFDEPLSTLSDKEESDGANPAYNPSQDELDDSMTEQEECDKSKRTKKHKKKRSKTKKPSKKKRKESEKEAKKDAKNTTRNKRRKKRKHESNTNDSNHNKENIGPSKKRRKLEPHQHQAIPWWQLSNDEEDMICDVCQNDIIKNTDFYHCGYNRCRNKVKDICLKCYNV